MARILSLRADTIATVADQAGKLLGRGGVLAVPTESVYGLAAAVHDRSAVRRLAAIKGRSEGKPFLVLIGHRQQLPPLVSGISVAARLLMEAFWPGPLTLIMPAAPGLLNELTAGSGTVAVRLVGRPDVARLIETIGPVTGTSANRSGEPSANTAEEVERILGRELDLILDGGPAVTAVPSTLVDTREPIKIVRQGAVERAQIVAVLRASGIVVT